MTLQPSPSLQFLSCLLTLQNVFGWQHRHGSRVLCRQEEGSSEEESCDALQAGVGCVSWDGVSPEAGVQLSGVELRCPQCPALQGAKARQGHGSG